MLVDEISLDLVDEILVVDGISDFQKMHETLQTNSALRSSKRLEVLKEKVVVRKKLTKIRMTPFPSKFTFLLLISKFVKFC